MATDTNDHGEKRIPFINNETQFPPALENKSPPPPGSLLSNKTPSKSDSKGDVNKVGVAIAASFFVLLVILFAILCIIKLRKKKRQLNPSPQEEGEDVESGRRGRFRYKELNSLRGGKFSYTELYVATNEFSPNNVLGHGGFGNVYKGVLPDGKEIAVKRLKQSSEQGEKEFMTEIDIKNRIFHRHLMALRGYCISKEQRLLVYKFLPNRTLDHHLHEGTLMWEKRLKIAVQSSTALAYLHDACEPPIIHRDVKTENILLDNNFDAQISDFGMAKVNSENKSHVSTGVKGTFGYMDPDYVGTGHLRTKSDVFSFGIILLELIIGKRPLDLSNATGESLVNWAKPRLAIGLEDGEKLKEVIDARLENDYNSQQMLRMVVCALACIQISHANRPKMKEIVRGLEKDVPWSELKDEMIKEELGVASHGDEDRKKYEKLVMEGNDSSELFNKEEASCSRQLSNKETSPH